jgi:putative FmdB family regulatory protein
MVISTIEFYSLEPDMPIFEFVCSECEQPFEELVRSAGAAIDVICPACGSKQVRKKISKFAAPTVGGGATGSSLFSSGASASASCSTGGL